MTLLGNGQVNAVIWVLLTVLVVTSLVCGILGKRWPPEEAQRDKLNWVAFGAALVGAFVSIGMLIRIWTA